MSKQNKKQQQQKQHKGQGAKHLTKAQVKNMVGTMLTGRVAESERSRKNHSRNAGKPRKGRGGGGGGRRQGNVGTSGIVVGDGINSSRVIVNDSVIEDTFMVRREKIANINGSTTFDIQQQLYINPGNTVLFPIFSQIAATYEQYRVNRCEFSYETEAYTASGSTLGAGKVIQVTNFDPDDTAFATDTQAENYSGMVKGAPYASTCHNIIQAHNHPKLGRKGTNRDFTCNNYYVYSSANQLSPLTNAAKFYDVGNYNLITNGNAGTTEIGELYVTYSFTMIRPKQQTPLGQNLVSAHFANTSASSTATNPFSSSGTGMVAVSQSNMALTFTGTTIIIPTYFNGRLQCNVLWTTASNDIASVPSVSAGTGGTLVANYSAGGLFSSLGNFLAAGTTSQISFCVDCVSGAVLTFAGNTSMAAADCDVHVAQISSNLALSVVKDPLSLELRLARAERLLSRLASVDEEKISTTPISVDSEMVELSENPLTKSIHIPRSFLSQFTRS